MSFDSIVRKGVALADSLTADLQDTIQYYAWIGSGTFDEPLYADPISMQAVVEERVFEKRLPSGQEVTQKAQVTVPRPLKPNGAANRTEPIDTRDKIVLPSGYTGPILDSMGVVDPTTHRAYMYVINLG